MTPIPEGPTLGAISEALQSAIDAQAETLCDEQGRTVAERFAAEAQTLRPLPATPFEARRTVLAQISRRVSRTRPNRAAHDRCIGAARSHAPADPRGP